MATAGKNNARSVRRYIFAGVAIGLIILAMMGMIPNAQPAGAIQLSGTIMNECDGRLSEIVVQYESQSADIVAPIYREFLAKIDASIVVHVLCPNESSATDLERRIGDVPCKLNFIPTGHQQTAWSRDRWINIFSPTGPAVRYLLCQKNKDDGLNWPQREGDEQIAFDLAKNLPGKIRAMQSNLYFDGGDFDADDESAFIAPAVAEKNIQRTVKDRDELMQKLAELTGKKVILFDQAPQHHVGMYLMPVGKRTVLVADPSMAKPLFTTIAESEQRKLLPMGADFSEQTQSIFDAVAKRMSYEGYRVVRIPVVPGAQSKAYITYVNVIMDFRKGQKIVYLPQFDGVEPLNAVARQTWQDLGFRVETVNCTSCYKFFGTLHCLVNVLQREKD